VLKTILAALIICVAVSSVPAAPIQWPASLGGNDHYYEFVLQPELRWTDAKTLAEGRTFNGAHGYLATVTSAGESNFMASHWPERGGADQNGWLGGWQDLLAPNYSEPAGGWKWVTGEPWVYTNWHTASGQPDNSGGSQNYIRSNADWQWDDFPDNPINPSVQYISGYFVEYTVPEPGMLLTFSVIGLLLVRSRQWRNLRAERLN
jgi:hypothetical protein